jgi:hypothetical protein
MIERKQNTLVLELKPKIEGNGTWGKNLVTIKIICYNYDECNKGLAKIIILNELSFNFIESQGFKSFCLLMQPRFDVLFV